MAPCQDHGVNEKRTTSSYAVLGLLSVQSWTTYELAKQVQRSLNWFWPRAERKLFDEPKRLVEQGLATASKQMTGQRPKTVYTISDKGRTALHDWLTEPAAPRTVEFEAMVKVFFADAGTREQLLTTLTRVEQEATERLATLNGLADMNGLRFPERAHLSALTLRLQFEQEHAVHRWATWATAQVTQWTSTTNSGKWDTPAQFAELEDPTPKP